MYIVRLSDKQFDTMDLGTRRSLIQQIMFISTPSYDYSIGANGNWWTMIRRDGAECIGSNRYGQREYPKDYMGTVVDKWT